MSFIAWHPRFKHPVPSNHRFPMLKYELLQQQLIYQGIAQEEDFFTPEKLDLQLLDGVHDKSYYERLLNLELTKAEIRRIGFQLDQPLIARELHIAQGTLQSAQKALKSGIGFNIAGGTHHAGRDWGEGFCMLNDQAIAAQYLLKHTAVKTILIIDLDVHQGNGTANIFNSIPEVFTFSMHGQNNFPFKKEKSDVDIGLTDGTTGKEYLKILEQQLDDLQNVPADFVFYQSGVDVLESDKMGKLLLTLDDCRQRDMMVFNFCKNSHLPVQVSMGGGYSKKVSDIVDAHTQTFKEGILNNLI